MASKTRLAEIVAQVQPRTSSVRICLRGDLIAEHERLERELAEARRTDADTNEPDEAPGIARSVLAVEAKMRDAEVEFVLQAMGMTAWSDLLAKHPPTKEQKGQRLDHNLETFSVAAVAASLIDPCDATEDDVRALSERMSLGEWQRLWGACLEANVSGDAPGESSAASETLRGSKQSSSSAALGESLAASSSDA